jgi:hypothetical protein
MNIAAIQTYQIKKGADMSPFQTVDKSVLAIKLEPFCFYVGICFSKELGNLLGF